MKEINKAIRSLQLDLNKQDEIKYRLKAIATTLKSLKVRIANHQKVLQKELDDVEELEGFNVMTLFVKFIGDLESLLDKERQEYLHAYLRHKAMLEEYSLLTYEQKLLKKKQRNVADKKKELRGLLQRKSEKLKKTNSQYYKKIIAIEKKIARCNTPLHKCKSAIKVGLSANTLLEKIYRDLNQTTQWGNIHEYHGQGRYSSMKKKTYIDKARQNVTKAKVLIDKYEFLVEQIFIDVNVQLSLDSFETFVDDFLDYLITDWVIQKKIKNAVQCLDMNIDKIVRHNYALQHEMQALEYQKSKLEKDKLALLDSY